MNDTLARIAEKRHCVLTEPLEAPNMGRPVKPHQVCPRWQARTCRGLAPLQECWSCCYADFHVTAPKPLDEGTCKFPDIQL